MEGFSFEVEPAQKKPPPGTGGLTRRRLLTTHNSIETCRYSSLSTVAAVENHYTEGRMLGAKKCASPNPILQSHDMPPI